MILHGNQRSGAKNLGVHLHRADNDVVRTIELRGVTSDNLRGALLEMEAIAGLSPSAPSSIRRV